MPQRPAAPYRLVAAGLLAALALSGCGGDDPSGSESPVSPTSQSAVESESPTPTPEESPTASEASPSSEPLSRFEDDPMVVVTRQYAAAVGRSVNRDEAQLASAWKYMSPRGRRVLPATMAEDMPHDFPGPLPFTPRAVAETGADRGIVRICIQLSGWARDSRTGLPVGERKIVAGKFVMLKVGGVWKVDGLQADTGDCSSIPVKGVPW